ncbi:MAG: hypothetical protein ABFC73_07240 [Clostridiaceae bacterium]
MENKRHSSVLFQAQRGRQAASDSNASFSGAAAFTVEPTQTFALRIFSVTAALIRLFIKIYERHPLKNHSLFFQISKKLPKKAEFSIYYIP